MNKVEALHKLASDALEERTELNSPSFTGSFEVPKLRLLFEALTTTDALDVLVEITKERND